MYHLPFGLTPRLPRWPWMSICLALVFATASLLMAPELIRHEQRIVKVRENIRVTQGSRWLVSSAEQHRRQNSLQQILKSDPSLNRWIYQAGKGNRDALAVSPWVIPQFALMTAVFLALVFFGGSIEMRIGSLTFGLAFVSLYVLGYLAELSMSVGISGVYLGGAAGIYILSAAYLALFARKDFSLWLGSNEQAPAISIPAWILAVGALVPLEVMNLGGYSRLTPEIEIGTVHLAVFMVSYIVFFLLRVAFPLPDVNYAPEELDLAQNLNKQVAGGALETVKILLQINPKYLVPVDIYYRRVIEPLGVRGMVTPENQQFLGKYLPLLVADHFDKKNFSRLVEMLRGRPEQVLIVNYLKFLLPREWLGLASTLAQRGNWLESLTIYQACLEYFADANLQSEVIKQVEVVIHRKMNESGEKQHLREAMMAQAKQFVHENPKSKISKVLIDQTQHLKKILKSENRGSGGDEEAA